MRETLARARRSLAVRGFRRTLRVTKALAAYRLRHGWRGPAPHVFDLEFGTDTLSLTHGHLPPGAVRGHPHEPVRPLVLEQLLAELPLDHREFEFIDFGCGQGRALMLAGRYPYRRVVGIEYCWEIQASARRNLGIFARGGQQRAERIEVVHADALDWELPTMPAVYYTFDPFPKPLVRRLAGRIRDSLRAAPRTAYLLYVGCYPELWAAAGFLPLYDVPGEAPGVFRAYRHGGGAASR